MKEKTKDIMKKIGIVISIIGAIGTIVATGNILFGHKGGGGSPGGGTIVNPTPKPSVPDSGGSGEGTGGGGEHVDPTPVVKLKDMAPTFCLGGINNDTGRYEKNNTQLFNRFAFGTKNLSIEVAPTSDIRYQVFYYDEAEKMVGNSPLLENTAKTFDIPVTAVNSRVEITPKNGAVITWDKIPYFANQLTIKANELELSDKDTVGIIDGQYGYDKVKGTPLMYVYNGVYTGTNYNVTVRNGLFTYNVPAQFDGDEEVQLRMFEPSLSTDNWAVAIYDEKNVGSSRVHINMDASEGVSPYNYMQHGYQQFTGTFTNLRIHMGAYKNTGVHSVRIQALYGDYRGETI